MRDILFTLFCAIAILGIPLSRGAAAQLPPSDANMIQCGNGVLDACIAARTALDQACPLPPVGQPIPPATAPCIDQAISLEQVKGALTRQTQVCTPASGQDCSIAKQITSQLLASFAKKYGIVIANPSPLPWTLPFPPPNLDPGANVFHNCSGTAAKPRDVSVIIVDRILARLQLTGQLGAAEVGDLVDLLDDDAVTTRDVIKHILDVHEDIYTQGKTTDQAVRYLIQVLLDKDPTTVPDLVASLVNAAESNGGLHAAADTLLTGDEYLNTVGDFWVPGARNYLPCDIASQTDDTPYVTHGCDDGPDAHTEGHYHVPRGYVAFGSTRPTTADPNPPDGYYAAYGFCQKNPRWFHIYLTARRSKQCYNLAGPHGPSTWIGEEVTYRGVLMDYSLVMNEAPDSCSHPARRTAPWASNPPVKCGPALASPGQCTIAVHSDMILQTFERNRCGAEGDKIWSKNLRNGDAVLLQVKNTLFLYQVKRTGDSKFGDQVMAGCADNGTITIP